MASENLEGAVVSFEYLDAKKKWCWGVGQVTRFDEHLCTIREWSSAQLDKSLAAKVESEMAAAKEDARKCQERLLAIREQMDSQATSGSKAEKERTSLDLSECLAESGKHRRHCRSLEDDLEKLKSVSNTRTTARVFSPSTTMLTILRSSVLQEVIKYSASLILLSSQECAAMETLAVQHRSQLAKDAARVKDTVEEAVNKFSEMQEQIRSLEAKVKQLDSTPLTSRGAARPEEISVLQDKISELEAFDSRLKWDDNAALVLTNHSYEFPWDDGKTLLLHKPEETKAVTTAEIAFACRVPIYCVTTTALKAGDRKLRAEFSVNHPLDVSMKAIDNRVASYSFPSLHHLHQNPLGPKVGLDRAIEELERALGVPEGKHEGLYFSEFVENMPDTSFSNDKDAYESEIGDLLMLLDKLNNENRSLQYTLDKAAAELKKQVAAAQKDQEDLNSEIARLRDIISKLKDLADQQEKELEENRLQRQRAEQARFRRNLQPPTENAGDPEYAVTMDEYTRQRDAADEAQEAFEQEKTKAEEMFERLKQYEGESAQHAEQMKDLEEALAAKEQATADSFNALEHEMLDVLVQLKASQGKCEALQALNAEQSAELKRFRSNRNNALVAREQHGGLKIHTPSLPDNKAEDTPINPETLAKEELYSVTLDEYKGMQCLANEQANQVEELTQQLASQKQQTSQLERALQATKVEEPIKLEVAAFRTKRNDALAARAADGSLETEEKPVSAEEAAARAVDPQQVAGEPLYAVTLEELQGARDEAAHARDEGDELRDALDNKRSECEHYLDKLEEALGLLEEARKENEGIAQRFNSGEAAHAEALKALEEELEKERAKAAKLGDEVAERTAAHEETAGQLRDAEAEAARLTTELEKAQDEAAKLGEEVAAFRTKRNDALAARAADGSLETEEKPVSAEEAAARAVDPQQVAGEPLYAATLEELQGARDEAEREREAAVENSAALEAELLDVLAQLKALEGENAALAAVGMQKDALIKDLKLHDSRDNNSDKTKPQSTSSHKKVFEGDDWDIVVEGKPQALHDAFVTDVCAACRVGRDDVTGVSFELGSLHASMNITHNSDLSAEAIAKMVEEYSYPNVWALYEKRNGPKEGRDAAEETIGELQHALASKEEELARLRDELEKAQDEAAKLGDEVAERTAAHEETAGQLRDAEAEAARLTTELEKAQDEAAKLGEEVAAFRTKRNDALAARAADGSLETEEKPVSAEEAAARAVDPQQVAGEPLYAVTLEEYKNIDAAHEDATEQLRDAEAEAARLAAELEKAQGEAAKLGDEVAERTAAHEETAGQLRDAEAEAARLAAELEKAQDEAAKLGDEVAERTAAHEETAGQLRDAEAEAARLTTELEKAQDEAAKLGEEVAAFRTKRNDALAARAADGSLETEEKPVSAEEAAARAVDPQQVAGEPLYAVTLEEYKNIDAAHEETAGQLRDAEAEAARLAAELEKAQDEAAKLGEEVAERTAAHEETAGQLRDAEAEAARLAAELEKAQDEAAKLGEEVAAFRTKRNDALAARAADGSLETEEKPVSAEEAAARAVDPQQVAGEPLYAATLEELQGARDEAEREREAAVENSAALEAELLDVLAQLKALEGENAALAAVGMQKDALIKDLKLHDSRDNNSDKTKPQSTSSHKKVFEGDDWDIVVEGKPQALHDAFVTDVCAACRVGRDDVTGVSFELGSLHASMNITHNSDLSAEAIAKMVEEYSYPNVWALYEKRNGPKEGRDAAEETIGELQHALASKEEELARLRDELEKAQDEAAKLGDEVAERTAAHEETAGQLRDAEAEAARLTTELEKAQDEAAKLGEEVAAFRTKRNDALAARAADGSLETEEKPVSAEEAAARAVDPQQVAGEPLYAVTLEEYKNIVAAHEDATEQLRDAEAEAARLAAELEKTQGEAAKLGDEVAERTAAHEETAGQLRDAEAEAARLAAELEKAQDEAAKLGDEVAERTAAHEETAGQLRDAEAEAARLAAELEKAQDEAAKLGEEVAAFRTKRNDALAARAADGSLETEEKPVSAEEAAARAVDPQQVAGEPLYAVTLEEYKNIDAAHEETAGQLRDAEAEAARLAAELEKAQGEAAKLGDEVAERTAAHEETAGQLRDAEAEAARLAAELEKAQDEAAKLGEEVAERTAAHEETAGQLRDAEAEAARLAAELEKAQDEAAKLGEEVAAFRTKRNDALAARAADGSLETEEKPVSAEEAAARAVDPQQVAGEPLYAATLEELQGARDEAEREREAAVENSAALEAELLDVLAQLKALEGENAALAAVGMQKDALIKDLKLHDSRDNNSDKTKPQSTSSHKKVFEGDDWDIVVEGKPQALHDAFVTDVCAACRVGRDDVTGVSFELGSLHASMNITHNSDLSAEAIAKMVEEYSYPNVWALYEKRNGPKEGRDAAEETIGELQHALASKEEELARLRDELEKAQDEAAKLGDEVAERTAAHEETAGQLRDAEAEAARLTTELEKAQDEAAKLGEEVAAFRTKRNDALAARAADGSLETEEKPVSAEEAAARAVDPQQVAGEPLYAVTLEEYKNIVAAHEDATEQLRDAEAEAARLAAELEKTQGEAAKLGDEVAERTAAHEETAGQLRDAEAEAARLAAELEKAQDEAAKLGEEVAAFRTKRNDALAARAADGSLETEEKPVSAEEAAARAVDPQQVAGEPLYAVTLEEYKNTVAAHEDATEQLRDAEAEAARLAAELEKAQGEAAKLGDEVAERTAAHEETAGQLRDAEAEAARLAAELEKAQDEAAKLGDEVAAFRTKRNDALAARAADGSLETEEKPVSAEEAAARAVDPQQVAGEPLYAATLEELQGARDEAEREREAAVENSAALEAELLDVLAQLKALEGENAALAAVGMQKDALIKDLKLHDSRDNNSDKTKPQSTSSHKKVFEGDDWDIVVEGKPQALHDAFVTDVCAACRVGRDDVTGVSFELGSLHASMNITHNSDLSAEAIAKMVEEYSYPNVWALYEKRNGPKEGRDAAEETIGELQHALASKEEELARLRDELEKAQDEAAKLGDEVAERTAAHEETAGQLRDAEAEAARLTTELEKAQDEAAKLGEEVAAFRTKRNDALAARAADGSLETEEKPVSAEEAAARAVDPQQVAGEPLYAVTLEEYKNIVAAHEDATEQLRDAEAEAARLAAELEKTQGEAAKLGDEVAERTAAHEETAGQLRDAEAEAARLAAELEKAQDEAAKLGDEVAERTAAHEETAGQLRDAEAEAARLAAELEKAQDEAAKLGEEVAAFRTKRNDALAARAADGSLETEEKPVSAEEAAARAVDPQQVAGEPLYAVTLEEYKNTVAAHEDATEQLRDAEAEAARLAAELEKAQGEAAKLGDEVAERTAAHEETAGQLRDAEAEAARLAAELEKAQDEAAKLGDEVAAFRTKRNDALAARAADGSLETEEKPVSAEEAAARAVDPQQVAGEPLYAATLEELQGARDEAEREREAAVENSAALEAELLDVLAQLKALEGENAALAAVGMQKDALIKDLKLHDSRDNNSDKTKPQSTSSHKKVFEGDDWDIVVEGKPQALHDAFVTDVCAACRVGRDDVTGVSFELGSLHASMNITHNSDLSAEAIAKMVEEYSYPNVWALYEKRNGPKEGRDAAEETIGELQHALASKEEELARLRDELEKAQDEAAKLGDEVAERTAAHEETAGQLRDAEAEAARLTTELEKAQDEAAKLGEEVAAFRTKRNDALAARAADGSLETEEKPVSAEEAAARAVDPQQVAGEPLYAVTLEEYKNIVAAHEDATEQLRDAEAEAARLAAELEKAQGEAAKLGDEVAERTAAHEETAGQLRDAEAEAARLAAELEKAQGEAAKLGDEVAERTAAHEETAGQLRDAEAEAARLAAELEKAQDEAAKLGEEVAAFRTKRNDALAARAADGSLETEEKPVSAEEAAARAVDPQQVAGEPLYAVTLEEYKNIVAAHEDATEQLRDAEAEAARLAAELEKAQGEAAKLGDEVAERTAAHEETAGQLRDAEAEAARLAAELEKAQGEAAKLGDEVAERTAAHEETAGQLRDAEAEAARLTTELEKAQDEAAKLGDEVAERTAAHEETAGQLRDAEAEAARLTTELEKAQDEAAKLGEEVAAFRTKRNDALAARAADGSLETEEKPVSAEEAAARAVDPQQVAGEPLYAVTLEEYKNIVAAHEDATEQLRDAEAEAARLAAELEKAQGEAAKLGDEVAERTAAHEETAGQLRDAEAEAARLAAELEKAQGEAAKLGDEVAERTAAHEETAGQLRDAEAEAARLAAELEKAQDEAAKLGEEVAAFRTKRNDALAARAADGSLETEEKPVSAEEAAARAVDPQQVAGEPLYAVTLEEYKNIVAAHEDATEQLRDAEAEAARLAAELEKAQGEAAKLGDEVAERTAAHEETAGQLRDAEAEAARLTTELEKAQDEAAKLGEEVAAFRTKRNDALAARAADGSLETEEKPVSAEEAAARAVDPQQVAGEPLYAVTLEEYKNIVAAHEETAGQLRDAEAEAARLAAELEKAQDEAAKLGEEVAERTAAHEETAGQLRDAEAEAARLAAELEKAQDEAAKLGEEVAERTAAHEETAGQLRDAEAEAARLAAELEKAQGEAAKLGDEVAERTAAHEETAGQLRDAEAEAARLTTELEKAQDEAAKLGEEVAAFRTKRNDALAARAADGSLETEEKPVSAEEAAARAVDPQQVAGEPLYAVTLEEYKNIVAAHEDATEQLRDAEAEAARLAAELEKAQGEAAKLGDEVAERTAAHEETAGQLRDAEAEAARLAAELEKAQDEAAKLGDEVAERTAAHEETAGQLRDAEAEAARLAAELEKAQDEAAKLGDEVAERTAAHEETAGQLRDAEAEAARLAAELEKAQDEAAKLGEEVAAFRTKRNDALAARAADGSLETEEKPVSAEEAAARAVDPQQVAGEPLYAATLEELQGARDEAEREREAAVENSAALEAELLDVLAQLKALEGENAALAAVGMQKDALIKDLKLHDSRDNNSDKTKPQSTSSHKKVFEGDDWDIVVEGKPQALHDAFVTDVCAACRVGRDDVTGVSFELGSLHASMNITHNSDLSAEAIAKMVEEYSYPNVWALYEKRNGPKEGRDAAEETIGELQHALASKEEELARLRDELEKAQDEAAKLGDEVAERTAAHEETAGQLRDAEAEAARLTTELEKAQDEAAKLGEEVAAFRTKRNDALAARAADGSLETEEKPVSAEEAAARAVDPQQVAGEPLYAVTLEEYKNIVAAHEETAGQLRDAEAEAARLAAELEKAQDEAAKLGEEVAERTAAHEETAGQLRDAEAEAARLAAELEKAQGEAAKLGDEVSERTAAHEETAGQLRDAEAEAARLTTELEKAQDEAAKLGEEVAAFRTKRNDALAARAADGSLETEEKPVSAEEAAARAVDPQQVAGEPLYAVTLEEYKNIVAAHEDATEQLRDAEAEAARLTTELEKAQDEAAKLGEEVAAFRTKRNDALAARAADGSLETEEKPVSAEEAAARAVDPQQVAGEPLYAVTLEEYKNIVAAHEDATEQLRDAEAEAARLAAELEKAQDEAAKLGDEVAERTAAHEETAGQLRDAEAEAARLAAELEKAQDEAAKLGEEVAAFRTKRNDALAARAADGSLETEEKPVSAEEAAARAVDPQQVAGEPLYAVTVEELQGARDEAARARDEVEGLRDALDNKRSECEGFLDKLEEAVGLLEEARKGGEAIAQRASEQAAAQEAALRAAEAENSSAKGELAALQKEGAQLRDEVRAFRQKRIDAIERRSKDGRLPVGDVSASKQPRSAESAVSPVIIEREPLFCVKLEELEEQRELNAQMMHDLDALGNRIRDAMEPNEAEGAASDALLAQLEKLLKELESAREGEQAARDEVDQKTTELAELRDVFGAQDERLRNDLEEAHAEVERLQGELDLLTEKLDEACKLFGDADAMNAEGVAKMEAFADLVAAARDAEKDALTQLKAKEDELAQLRQALQDTHGRDDMIDALQDEVAQLQKEKEITETELVNAQKDLNDARQDLRAAEDKTAEKVREVESMTLDLDALNSRIQDLLEELEEKTDQYNQVIKDLDDFAKNQNREDEKELLQRLAAREQELFELQEARRGENEEHEKQIGVLQDQINRLRDQTDKDNTLHDGLQSESERLRKALADAEEAMRAKDAEIEGLRDDIEGMIDEHEAQMREMEAELEDKSKEVSDALERLEEMSAMVQEAREGEESALRLRADSDAEVFRLQKELDKLKQLQNAMVESGGDKDGLLTQVMDAEAQLREAEAARRKKEAEFEDAERCWRDKLNNAEDLNRDLRRLLKRTMAALSTSKDTMGSSAGALDSFRDELKPMMQ